MSLIGKILDFMLTLLYWKGVSKIVSKIKEAKK